MVAAYSLEVGETKTEKGTRSILLPPSTLHLLKERKKKAVTEWIFPSLLAPEKPTSPNAAYQRLKDILKGAGLPDIRFHDLRHPYVKLTTKNIFCKSRNPKLPLPITWGFCFCWVNHFFCGMPVRGIEQIL
jgi:hypothetical protein